MTTHPTNTDINFTKLTNELSRKGHLVPIGAALPVWIAIAQNLTDVESNYTECSFSYSKLCELTGLNKETIGKHVAHLEKLGYLRVRRIQGSSKIKERLIYSIPSLPETIAEKPSKNKGGDIKKATEVRLQPHKERKAKVEAKKAEIVPDSKLYGYYLKLHTSTTLDLWTETQFTRSKGIKAAIEKYGIEELEKSYVYVTRFNLPDAKDYILNPSKAVEDMKRYEKSQEILEEINRKEIDQREQERRQEEEEDRINQEICKLFPEAIESLLRCKEITEQEVGLLSSTTASFSSKTRIYSLVSKKANEIYQASLLQATG